MRQGILIAFMTCLAWWSIPLATAAESTSRLWELTTSDTPEGKSAFDTFKENMVTNTSSTETHLYVLPLAGAAVMQAKQAGLMPVVFSQEEAELLVQIAKDMFLSKNSLNTQYIPWTTFVERGSRFNGYTPLTRTDMEQALEQARERLKPEIIPASMVSSSVEEEVSKPAISNGGIEMPEVIDDTTLEGEVDSSVLEDSTADVEEDTDTELRFEETAANVAALQADMSGIRETLTGMQAVDNSLRNDVDAAGEAVSRLSNSFTQMEDVIEIQAKAIVAIASTNVAQSEAIRGVNSRNNEQDKSLTAVVEVNNRQEAKITATAEVNENLNGKNNLLLVIIAFLAVLVIALTVIYFVLPKRRVVATP